MGLPLDRPGVARKPDLETALSALTFKELVYEKETDIGISDGWESNMFNQRRITREESNIDENSWMKTLPLQDENLPLEAKLSRLSVGENRTGCKSNRLRGSRVTRAKSNQDSKCSW